MKIDKKYIVVAVVLLAIGFASVTTTLLLRGNVEIGSNVEEFVKDVVFTKAETDEGGSASIIEEGKKITFTSKVLSKVNDIATLDFDITNYNQDYDADVEINCTLVSNTHQEYIKVISNKPSYEIHAQETVTDKITATLIKPLVSEENIEATLTCTLDARAKPRSNKAPIKDRTYKESLLNGTDPILKDELIPVTLSNDGTVTIADINNKWYEYGNKEWANAVILKESPSKTYKAGEVIKEEDIDAYFVWIPKYKYKLWNVNVTNPSKTAHSIEIEFGIDNTTDEAGISCVTPMTSGSTGNCANGLYMTHPAFITFGVNGFWVGKFETGYRGATSTAGAEQNNNNSANIIVKPNVYSWRNATIKNFFEASYNYKRNLDSHMMKNTEWGAVAYLSHSKYGIDSEIRTNNNSDFKTGYASITAPTCFYNDYISRECNPFGNSSNETLPYNTNTGYSANTTGNITGIYDMGGGSFDSTASYIRGKLGSSDFVSTTIANYNEKYFDVYSANSGWTTYNYRILGDATGELGPVLMKSNEDNDGTRPLSSWYNSSAGFLDSFTSSSWLHRGGSYSGGTIAGQFYFYCFVGGALKTMGTRLVLAP